MITIPTQNEIYTSIISNLEAQYGITISLFGKVFLRAFAVVQASKLWLTYLAIGNLQKNIFVDTADSESVGGTLERFGRVKLGRNPYQALAGQYILTVTGSIGAVIKASTTFKSDDTSNSPGFLFVLDNEYILVNTTDTITVRALVAGLESKLNVNDTLTPTSPIALVNSSPSSAVVSSIFIEPKAAEDLEDYRQKIIDSYRLEPTGGAATDYRLWAADAQGVRLVYPYAKSGATGEVNLFVEATVADSIDGKGTPSASLLVDVEDVIDFNPDSTLPLLERGRRPIQVIVHYIPVTIREVDIIITNYIGINATIQALLLTELTNAINDIRPFVDAADILVNKNNVIDVNKIIAVIINQNPGAIFSGVSIEIDGNPVSTYTFLNGDIPHLNSVTYN